MPIRPVTIDDVPAIRQLAVDAGMFQPDETGFVVDSVAGSLDGSQPDHHWIASVDESGALRGAAYYAPEPMSDRVWNLYFIAVDPRVQSRGRGGALVEHVASALKSRGEDVARVLLVETSSSEQYRRTRAFYPRHRFEEEARIRDYYGPNEHKVVFWRRLNG